MKKKALLASVGCALSVGVFGIDAMEEGVDDQSKIVAEDPCSGFGGFYLGGGVSHGHGGQGASCYRGSQYMNFSVPLGNKIFGRVDGGDRAANAAFQAADLAATTAALHELVLSGNSGITWIAFTQENGDAPALANFTSIGATANNSVGYFNVITNNYVIKGGMVTRDESVNINEKKGETTGVAALGFGHVVRDRFYVGLEGLADFHKTNSSSCRNMSVKTSGVRPQIMLRLGYTYLKDWLFYVKAGVTYVKATASFYAYDAKRCSAVSVAPTIGFGVEKKLGRVSLRLDADYVKGKNFEFQTCDWYKLNIGEGRAAPPALADHGRVGPLSAIERTFKVDRTVKAQRKGVFNARVILSYHVKSF